MAVLTMELAKQLVHEHTKQPHLLEHALAVSVAMEAMAEHFGEDAAHWAAVGYVHDVDYEEFPEEHLQEAMEYLAQFITCGQQDGKPAPKLIDWEQDAQPIIADVNKVAGTEIRALPFLHWWTFMAWFNAIGEGQLSMLVTIRDKLRRGKKLEKHEQEYYRQNRSRVDLKRRYSADEEAEFDHLKQLLGG